MKLNNLFLALFLFLALLTACEDDEVINPLPVDPSPPIAKAGNDTTLVAGGKIILDGTGSSDPEDKTLTYSWTIKTKPEGSAATLQSADKVKAYLTPDVAGSYTFELTVNNGKVSAKDEKKATVTNPAYAGCVVIEDDITTATTWAKIAPAGEVDYCVKEGVGVYAKLIIEPGVIIEFEENTELYIDDAEIIAKGTATNKIIFTGKEKTKGYWKGIELSSAESEANIFEYCEISYTGSTNHVSGYKAGISLRNGALVSLKNTTISHSNGYGMVIPHGSLNQFSTNTFAHNTAAALYIEADQMGKLDSNSKFVGENGRNGVEVDGGTIDEDIEVLWPAFADGGKFFIMDEFIVRSGVKVQEGAVLEFDYDAGIYIDGTAAYLLAKGTADKKITFTGIAKEKGAWKGIEFSGTENTKNQLDYCQISYAGSNTHVSSFLAGISARNGATFKITNSLIEHTNGYGIAINYGGFQGFGNNTFSNNSLAALQIPADLIGMLDPESKFTGNNAKEGVEVTGATVDFDTEQVWPAFKDGSKYFVIDDITLYSGVKVQEGAIFEFSLNANLYIDGNAAYLFARGTADKKIIFTGAQKTKGSWTGLEFSGTSNGKNELSHCEVSYGGSNSHVSGYKANISLRNGGQVKVFDSSITQSAGWGIVEYSGTLLKDDTRPIQYSGNTSGDFTNR